MSHFSHKETRTHGECRARIWMPQLSQLSCATPGTRNNRQRRAEIWIVFWGEDVGVQTLSPNSLFGFDA